MTSYTIFTKEKGRNKVWHWVTRCYTLTEANSLLRLYRGHGLLVKKVAK